MTARRVLGILLFFLAIVAWVQVPLALERLPERVATHFDGAGNANGWMTRNGLFAFWSGLIGFLLFSFVATFAITSLVPDRWINLPHKDYWLAPERRQQTLDRVAVLGLGIGCACMAFMAVTIRMLLNANIDGTQRLDSNFIWYALAFAALVIVSALRFTVRFYRVPKM